MAAVLIPRSRAIVWWSVSAWLLAVSFAATGCAAVYDGKYAFSSGWRRATVASVVPGALLEHPRSWECARGLSSADLASRTYAVVWYVSAHSKSYFAVELPSTQAPLAPGSLVYVNVFDCGQPPVTRAALAQGTL